MIDTKIIKTRNLSHSLMGKFQRNPKSNSTRWNEFLKLYRASKLTTELIDRFSLIRLAELSGYSTSYISGVEGFHIKPSGEYILVMQRIKQVLNEKI